MSPVTPPRTRRRMVAGLLMFATFLSATTVALGIGRLHRLILPPPDALPSALSVDEDEWYVTPSKTVVASGDVTFRIFNRGEDDHDFAVQDSAGVVKAIELAPGANGEVVANLAPGMHKIWCTLPGHEALGMVAQIEAKPQPEAVVELERQFGT